MLVLTWLIRISGALTCCFVAGLLFNFIKLIASLGPWLWFCLFVFMLVSLCYLVYRYVFNSVVIFIF